MTIQVEISPEAEAQLTAAAGARGIPVEAYAGRLLQEALQPQPEGLLTLETLEDFTRKLTEGSESMPVLTLEANDRASYYEDRR